MKFNSILIETQKKELKHADLLIKDSKEFIEEEKNISKAIDFINNSLSIYKKYKIYNKVKDAYNCINQYLNQYNQIEEAKDKSVEALAYFESEIKSYKEQEDSYTNLKQAIANSYANHGIALTREEDFETARYYFSLSASVYDDYGNWDQRTQLYINLAGVNKVVGNFNQSIHYLNKSLKHASSTSDSNNIYLTIILQLGNLYMLQENFQKSIEFFENSFRYANANEMLQKFSINVYYCFAHCYLELSDEKKCIENLEKAKDLDDETDAKLYEAHIALLQARLYTKKGSFEKAIPCFAESLKIDWGISAKTRRLNCINDIIDYKILAPVKYTEKLEQVLRQNYLPDFEQLLKELEETKVKIYNIWSFKKIYGTLSKYYEKQENYKEAHKFSKKINDICSRLAKININDQIDTVHHNFDIYLLKKQIKTAVESKNTLINKNTELEHTITEKTKSITNQNELLKEFINIVAHDLKEPARNINSHIDFYLKQTKEKLSEKETLLINKVLGNSKRLILMMDDLIVYSFLSEHFNPAKTTSIYELTNALIKTYSIPQDISKVTNLLSNLPDIKMSSNHITQIFRRLIDNAIKFKSQDRALELTISTFQKNNQHFIKIQDNGIGFNQQEASKAFKIFQKLNEEDYSGNGVGLAICKKIVELYGQSISIETQPNKGCAVTFSVPT